MNAPSWLVGKGSAAVAQLSADLDALFGIAPAPKQERIDQTLYNLDEVYRMCKWCKGKGIAVAASIELISVVREVFDAESLDERRQVMKRLGARAIALGVEIRAELEREREGKELEQLVRTFFPPHKVFE